MSLLLSSLSVNRCTILFFIVNSKFSRINNEPPVSHCLVICLTSVPLLSLTLTVCGSLKLPNPLMYSTFLKNNSMSAQFKVKQITDILISYYISTWIPKVLQVSISTISNQAQFSFHKFICFKTQKYVIDSYNLNLCINIIERITCLGVAPCDPSSRISHDSVQLLIKSPWNETMIG